jgi:Ribonuclease HI
MKDKFTFMAYTDASSYNNGRKDPTEPEHSCSAGVVTIGDNVVYSFHNYNPNTSISYGELFAIYTLLNEFVPLLEDSKCKLILHTDSEYCFKSINTWYKKWKDNARNGIWYTPHGAVPYQKMLQGILKCVDNKKIIIKHISGGHFDVLKPNSMQGKEFKKSLKKCKERYLRNNNEKISDDVAMNHIFWNNICDIVAKTGLSLGMEGRLSNEGKRKSFKKYIT